MARIFISPSKYVQGPGELARLGTYAASYGKKALVLISAGGMRRSGDVVRASFEEAGVGLAFDEFGGECSQAEIDRISGVFAGSGADMVVGIGGGKIFDTAKAVASAAEVPVLIVPTIAATDAPCSALSVVYTDEGQFKEYQFYKQNPNLVLMDTEVIAKSPVRLTVSGMGDALATYFEARACFASASDNIHGGKSSHAAQAIARLCYDILLADGVKAKQAVEHNLCTQAVENIIEANTLLSGIGFESGGKGAAHSIGDGLNTISHCRQMKHGEKVAFGTLVQLMMENASAAQLYEAYGFCRSVGLPVTLAQLSITEDIPSVVAQIAAVATQPEKSTYNMPFPVSADSVADAILAADVYGTEFLKR